MMVRCGLLLVLLALAGCAAPAPPTADKDPEPGSVAVHMNGSMQFLGGVHSGH